MGDVPVVELIKRARWGRETPRFVPFHVLSAVDHARLLCGRHHWPQGAIWSQEDRD